MFKWLYILFVLKLFIKANYVVASFNHLIYRSKFNVLSSMFPGVIFMDVIIRILIFLLLPIFFLILGRGLKTERLLFAGYIFLLCVGSFCFTQKSSLCIKVGLFFIISSFILSVLFNIVLLKKIHYRLSLILSLLTALFGVPLLLCFPLQTQISIETQEIFLTLRWNTATSILILAITTLFLISLEEVLRNYYFSLQEKIFFLGTCFGWMSFIFLIYHQGITIDKVPISISYLLISFILLCTLSAYFLIKKGAFFNINFHPSPIVVIRFTFTIAFLLSLMIIIAIDIFTRLYFPLKIPYIEIFLFFLFFILLCIFIFPPKYLKNIKQKIYHHFYLPAQDYALEVKFFLSVINKDNWQKEFILHIYEKLPVNFVGLYVCKEGKYILETKFPLNADMPEVLKNIPINAIPLQAETNVMGYLYINPIKKFTMEQKELIQFWASTMGFLLHYFQEKEKQEQRQKLMIFSQAAAFILHDAKNLAQLLKLLEKNYQRAKAQDDVQSFIQELLPPSLEQAKMRAERIIKRLNIFHPLKLHLETIDLVFFLKESVHKFQHVIPRVNISFFTSLKKANIKIDPDLLNQILENLFFNAYQAGATKIIVELTSQDNGYLLKVEDNGSGIKLKDRKKLFTPFFTTKPKGTGLGLYQAKVLLERIGNRIWYKPNRDKGSIFYVWFKK